MSVTRREFFLGTVLTAVLTAVILAAVFVAGGVIEQATGGWGMDGYFFYIPWIWDAGPAAAGLFFFALALLFFVIGFWGSTIYKRWGTAVLTSVSLAIALLMVGVLWLIGRLDAWAQVGMWLADNGAFELTLWGLLLIVVLAVASYLTLRRTVP